MKLSDYCEGQPDRKAVVAKACKVTEAAVRHWCNGTRIPPPKHWPAIEQATQRKVTSKDWLSLHSLAA